MAWPAWAPSFLNWEFWRNKTFRLDDPNAPVYGGSSWSGEVVTVHGAMQLSAFWACVRLISQTIATLPLSVFERLESGEKVSRSDHPLYRLLHDSPNADQTAVEFWEGRLLGICTSGNGYAEKVLGAGGRLVSLEPMPADTSAHRLEDGSIEYRFMSRGTQRKLPEEQVFHIRGFGDDPLRGLSPVAFATQALSTAIAAERASGQMFGKGMRAKGFFTVPQLLTPDQRTQAQKVLVDPFTGPNGKDWGVLEAGFDFKTVNISAKDAELILSRKFNIEDICRWHGVPPMLIGHAAEGQTMWGSGVEQIMLGWLTLGLRPYLTRIEQAIKKRLIAAGERDKIFAEFNVEGLLRADSAGRAAFYSSCIQNAIMKPNEARSKENLPHEEGGDQLLINSTLIPLAMAGKQQQQPPQAPQPKAKIMSVTKHDKDGRIAETVTREIEEV